jgi:hypothetical protein
MESIQLIKAFFEQATAQGSRSTILRPLGWLIAICAAATLTAVELKAPNWIIFLFGISSALGILLYLAAYIYCLAINKPDLLRSETYSIQKLAIEKGFVGDSLAGVFRPQTEDKLLLGPNQTDPTGGK